MSDDVPKNVIRPERFKRRVQVTRTFDPTDWWIEQGTAQYEAGVRCLKKHASKAYLRELLLQTLEECRTNEAAS